jgi:beta-lactamase class A
LHRVDVHQENLDRNLSYGPEGLLERAPITKQHVGQGGMTVRDLCAAAIEYSDNTAGNLLLKAIGGPEGLTQYARSLGGPMTRLDRTEPTLNTGLDGDERDTATPDSMLQDLRELLLTDKLSAASRQQLEAWLVANTTGNKRLRAGLPKDWRAGIRRGPARMARPATLEFRARLLKPRAARLELHNTFFEWSDEWIEPDGAVFGLMYRSCDLIEANVEARLGRGEASVGYSTSLP